MDKQVVEGGSTMRFYLRAAAVLLLLVVSACGGGGGKAYIYIHADGGLGEIQVIDLTASIAPGPKR